MAAKKRKESKENINFSLEDFNSIHHHCGYVPNYILRSKHMTPSGGNKGIFSPIHYRDTHIYFSKSHFLTPTIRLNMTGNFLFFHTK